VKKPTPFGKYFLLERINVGGMAEVFRAKAFGVEGFERLVAVKRILSNIAEDKEFIRMFIEEAKLSVQLNHANIAQIFDLGVVDGAYYIALEHVHGRDLRGIFDRCRQLGEAMPVAQACFVAMKVCEGLDYAHNKRDQGGHELSLVHRDVSPQNILVSFEGEVKLIDFGIAKAAGTGAKTQAGILKGKFGYMSPEQVRGLTVDRRSDVFSCGIVLYELLTGERLFVGESDFSTLEKVRNVEILPPSTYNRKIPDELERIVLKALTKDPDDRYQNAIDLHDELQAFVYTAGEFYSRKELAGWMKKTFGKEIEEETAKLESYRQLKPPEPKPGAPSALSDRIDRDEQLTPAAVPRSITASRPIAQRRPTQPAPVGKSPLPPSVSRSQPVPVVVPASTSSPIPAAASARVSASSPVRGIASGPHKVSRQLKPNDSGWDDDEIETQIYDGDDSDPKRKASTRSNLPLQPPVSSSPGITLPSGDPYGEVASSNQPLVAPNGAGWNAEMSPAESSMQISVAGGGMAGGSAAPATFPSGSSNAPAPFPPDPIRGRELSAPHRLVSASTPQAGPAPDPMAEFGARITGRRQQRTQRRSLLPIVIGGAAVVAISVIVAILLTGGSRPKRSQGNGSTGSAELQINPELTGFDLYVTPAGISQWRLDSEVRTDRLPARIRGITAGVHSVQIDPPPGFMSQHQTVTVEPGKSSRVEITLQPIANIVGVFDSSPPGASVSLIVDGKRQDIGPSPAKAPLDPRNTYRVLFEKPGYVSVNRPVTFSGGQEERIVANLEKATSDKPPGEPSSPTDHVAPRPPPPQPSPPPRAPPERPAPDKTPPPKLAPEPSAAPGPDKGGGETSSVEPKDADPKAKGQGVLVLGSKPPCEIAIDGSPTGLRTPQKEIKLSVGRHRVTLTNSEFNIKETFNVDIKADTPEKAIKDYSDQLPN
jgi:serine/threonine protein kinase